MLRSNPYVISTAATQIYTLSLHDALPIYLQTHPAVAVALSQDQLKLHAWVYEISSGEVFSYDDSSQQFLPLGEVRPTSAVTDRKSTRLNSSHLGISYAVFCLKKKRVTLLN